MKKSVLSLIFISILLTFVSCRGDDPTPTPPSNNGNNDIAEGLFILNEGTFTYANSSLTFYDPEADTVTNNLFYKVNVAPLGDVANSMMMDETGMYIVVNNSKYIYKVDPKTMKYEAKLEGLTSPRHIVSISKDKAYISDQESTGLWIFNPSTMQKTGFIELGNTTEKMVRVGNEVVVTNWSNFYQPETSNSTIQFVNVETDELVDEVEVAAEPNSIVLDKDNNIWVLCSGGYLPPCEPSLFCINPSTREILKRIDFAEGDYPSSMAIDNEKENLYILNGGFGTLNLYKMSIDDEMLPTNIFVNYQQSTDNGDVVNHVFTNVAVSPENGDIYLTDVKDYIQNGDVLRFDSNGNFITKFEAGIIPGFMMFN
ncbi:MAG: hypothetical protein IJZ87_03975 [Bacteroidales bacterium]|nr:hypothetical protein [Bacteroidales bacterium]